MSSKPARPLGARGLAVTAAATLVLGVLGGIGAALLSERPGPGGMLLTGGFISLMLAAVFAVSIWWWRRVDEAAREAHKWSWFWGGSCGMLVGFVFMLTLSVRDTALSLPVWVGSSPVEILNAGMMSILLFQLAGYAIAWAWWWWTRR